MSQSVVLLLYLISFVNFNTSQTNSTMIFQSEYIEFSTSSFTSNGGWPWGLLAVFLGLLLGIFVSSFIHWLYDTYLLIRRYKYGIITDSKIISKVITEHKNRDKKSYTYRIKYIYNDCRDIITTIYMKYLMDKLITMYCNDDIPIEIIDLCLEYIGDSMKFWYGPFTMESIVTYKYFQAIHIDDIIQIKYDPKYPQNCIMSQQTKEQSIIYWIKWSIKLILSLGGSIYFSFSSLQIIKENNNEHMFEMILLIISIILLVTISFMICTNYIRGFGCFSVDIQHKLQCADIEHFNQNQTFSNDISLLGVTNSSVP